MAEPHVISALIAKRAELTGAIIDLERKARSIGAMIGHIDSCLEMFGYADDPRKIAPMRRRGESMFKHGHLQRMVLDMRRTEGALSNREIAARIIEKMGWDRADGALLLRVAGKVKDVTKRYPERAADAC